MKKAFYIFSLMLMFSLAPFVSYAQPPNPGGGGNNDPNCYPPPCVPIDGGLSWLLIAGTVYGGKKMYDLGQDKKKVD